MIHTLKYRTSSGLDRVIELHDVTKVVITHSTGKRSHYIPPDPGDGNILSLSLDIVPDSDNLEDVVEAAPKTMAVGSTLPTDVLLTTVTTRRVNK